jgi:hypothetical protein
MDYHTLYATKHRRANARQWQANTSEQRANSMYILKNEEIDRGAKKEHDVRKGMLTLFFFESCFNHACMFIFKIYVLISLALE